MQDKHRKSREGEEKVNTAREVLDGEAGCHSASGHLDEVSMNDQLFLPLLMEHGDNFPYLKGSFFSLTFKLGMNFKKQMAPVCRCILADSNHAIQLEIVVLVIQTFPGGRTSIFLFELTCLSQRCS